MPSYKLSKHHNKKLLIKAIEDFKQSLLHQVETSSHK